MNAKVLTAGVLALLASGFGLVAFNGSRADDLSISLSTPFDRPMCVPLTEVGAVETEVNASDVSATDATATDVVAVETSLIAPVAEVGVIETSAAVQPVEVGGDESVPTQGCPEPETDTVVSSTTSRPETVTITTSTSSTTEAEEILLCEGEDCPEPVRVPLAEWCGDTPPANGGVLLKGTPGNDVLRGTSGDDVICGLGGDDTIFGLGGDDQLSGDAGNDTIDGGPGRDQIAGLIGNDTLRGGDGNDMIVGADGSDELFGDLGDDILTGGEFDGVDRANGGAGINSCFGVEFPTLCSVPTPRVTVPEAPFVPVAAAELAKPIDGKVLFESGSGVQVLVPSVEPLPYETLHVVGQPDLLPLDSEQAFVAREPDDISLTGYQLSGRARLTLNIPRSVTDLSDLGMYYFDETTGRWNEVPSTTDAIKRTVSAEVSHFSSWAIFHRSLYLDYLRSDPVELGGVR